MKKIIAYFPFPLVKKPVSGSQVRPVRMIEALQIYCEENGYELLLLAGESRKRKQIIKQWERDGIFSNVVACYGENQTIPLWLTDSNHIPKAPLVDWKFFRLLHQYKIPFGFFYRDVNWKFEELFGLRGMRHFVLKQLYQLEERLLNRYVDTCFLPSPEMANYVHIGKTKSALPPGAKAAPERSDSIETDIPHAIYVGGISPRYGIELLLDSFHRLNQQTVVCRLILVCRSHEFEASSSQVKEKMKAPFIEVVHASGDALQNYYHRANFAIIPILNNEYNSFAIPVKLFEYMSYGLPIVATNLLAQARIIQEEQIGILAIDRPESFSEALAEMTETYPHFIPYVQKAFTKHTWEERARIAMNLLIQKDR
ncbi:glycosyltransferase [Neobacillus drentensis]|uniref:glycosyltransferase family 4 protein n=1 Tax=Neobacillus drentensis TaxID=220684 RepID=UPI002FFDFA38